MKHEDLVYKGQIPAVTLDGGQVLVSRPGIPADPKAWPEPVHVAFANLKANDPQVLAAFAKTYGTSGQFTRKESPDAVAPEYVEWIQEELRHGWDTLGAAKEVSIRGSDLAADLSGGVVRLSTHDLNTFLWVSFLIDRANGLTHVCEYSRCPRQRYFLKVRSDQKFCSSECRALHNMELWRADPKNKKREQRRRRKK